MPKDFEERALSPQEIQRREFERRTMRADKDREIKDDDGDELIALQLNPNATRTLSGKPIRGHNASRHKDRRHQGFQSAFMNAMGLGNAINDISSFFRTWRDGFMAAAALPLASAPSLKAASRDKDPLTEYEDDGCIINMENVSRQTARILNEERAEIEEKVRELAGITDPAAHNEFAAKIILLAEKYDMIEHPKFPGHYIHTFTRVQREEAALRARGINPDCADVICVYRIKAEIGGDAVKVQRSIGDVLNQNPAEVQLNVNEEIAAKAAAPVPSLEHH